MLQKIELPPLRRRKEDIRVLIDYFFKHFKEKEKTNLKSISEETYCILKNHQWAGNVRELYYTIQSACAKARSTNDTILQINHLSDGINKSNIENKEYVNQDLTTEQKKILIELEEIENTLEKTNGKKR